MITNLIIHKFKDIVLRILRIKNFYLHSHNVVYNNMKSEYFLERDDIKYTFKDTDVKAIAMYLPQFHPIPENDSIWERNFTEWTNVTKAKPNFVGQSQPRLPYECGFYDLRIVDNIRWQAELSKQYGIYGWCIMYYFFDGTPVMDTPLNLILDNPDIDIQFCLEWANESWTRRWTGREDDITLLQDNSHMDTLIRNILEIAKDPRYIKINNVPVLMIYRKDILPNMNDLISLWRKIAKEEFNTDIYLVLCETFDIREDPLPCNAALQYPPHPLCSGWFDEIRTHKQVTNPNFTGGLFSYEDIVNKKLYIDNPTYTQYKMLILDWDNTARKGNEGVVFHGCTPSLYTSWLSDNIRYSHDHNLPFTFINAWNEWAEGTYLEPDRVNGYRYLFETRETLTQVNNEYSNSNSSI